MTKVIKQLTQLCILASTVSLISGEVNATTNADWQMVWSDEFTGTEIDSNNWSHVVDCRGGGNREQQCYTDSEENSFTSGGTLKIVALPAAAGAKLPYTSARLITRYKADFKYGRFEMSAKLPAGQGSWPAFWMKSTDEVYGTWPKSGELDIMEAINLKTPDEDGSGLESTTTGTLHYGKFWPDNSHSGQSYNLPNDVNPADGFHTYAVEWEEGEIRWYVDNVLFETQRRSEIAYNEAGEVDGLSHRGWFAEYVDAVTGEDTIHWDNSPYDQPFFMILNFAVGGTHPEDHNDGGIDASAFANGNTYEIDYVRVYQCSLDVDTGKGCTTGTVGDTLIEGKAPPPPPPILPPTGEDLDIFAGAMNANWPAYFSNGSTPLVVTDADKGDVVEFSINSNPTVVGFLSREANITDPDGVATPHNASTSVAAGVIRFDMKVMTMPYNSNATWTFKVESVNGDSAVNVSISDSVEGVKPTAGQWQSYSFNLSDLAAAGLDVEAIDAIMIYPGWSSGEGAVYRVTNLAITTGAVEPAVKVVLFEDAENLSWQMWDSSSASIPVVVTDDDNAYGTVAEFSIGAAPAVMGFTTRAEYFSDPTGTAAPFDATSIVANGVVQFDLKVVNMPSDPSTTWDVKVESVGSAFAKVELTDSIEGIAPVVGQWQAYTFKLSDLELDGLDLSAIDTLLVYPNWGDGADTVYRVDNVKIYDPTAPENFEGHLLFGEQAQTPWGLRDCCAGSTPMLENDDTEHGMTAEFAIGTTSTLAGLQIATDGVYLDASDVLSNGVVQFEIKVIDPITTAGGYWQIKMESGDGAANKTFKFIDSQEGVEPVTGQWQTYTYSLQSFYDAGIDVSEIDVLFISPNWSGGAGTKYRLDNVMIYDPSSLPTPQGIVIYDTAENSAWPMWDSSYNTDPVIVTDEDNAHGAVAEFAIVGNAVMGFVSKSSTTTEPSPYDATSIVANGVVQFDLKVINMPSNPSTAWYFKIESVGSAFAKFELTESIEGIAPIAGQWQTYTFNLSDLSLDGLDVSAIDTLLMYPHWGDGDGTVYRVDNVKIF